MTAYVSKRLPRARQAEAMPLIHGRDVFAIRAAFRVGKTKIIVDDWGEAALAGDCVDLLVVSPGGALPPWVDAVRADLPDELMARTKIFRWISQRARTKTARLELEDFLAHDGPRVLLVNAEAISSVRAARELCVQFLRQRPGKNEAVISESVVVKNPKSECGKFCVDVLAPLAARRRIESGLMTPRSPLDLWNQFRFLDWQILGHATFATFQSRYARIKNVCMVPGAKLRGMLRTRLGLGGYLTHAELQVRAKMIDPELNAAGMAASALRSYLETMVEVVDRDRMPEIIKALGGYVQTIPVVEGYDHIEELHDLIAPHSWRCRLEDCVDLPPSDYSFRDVEMHPEQRRVYDELRENATAELASMDHVTATHVIVRMLRLHQVLCGHAVDDEERLIHDVPEYRTRELVQLLDDYEGKAIVWASYDHSVRRISDELTEKFGARSVARFWGGNARTREEEEIQFKTSDRCRFMVATPDAGGRGRDWSVADLSVYYSSRNNLDHRMQSEDRVKSADRPRPKAYVDMIVRGTVEEKILSALRSKMDLATVIHGDDWREWIV
jgi:hypothetical protein